MKKIVIAGSSGFIGKDLVRRFEALHYEVLQISRKPEHIQWNDFEGIVSALNHSEALINLAGKSVDCQYTKKNKTEILESRIKTTKQLGEAVNACENPPKAWINSSTATIYRHETTEANTESKGIIGSGFSVDVAKEWEKTFFTYKNKNTRLISLRMAIVLSENGGALPILLKLVKLGLGGKQGDGEQYFSWIDIRDLFEIILFCIENKHLEGPINCCSPYAVKNKDLMSMLRTKENKTFGLNIPALLLKLGSISINTEAELVLKSRWVYPEKLLQNNFQFEFKSIENSLNT
jgi:uncharacterized protein (TIGR01777 family)